MKLFKSIFAALLLIVVTASDLHASSVSNEFNSIESSQTNETLCQQEGFSPQNITKKEIPKNNEQQDGWIQAILFFLVLYGIIFWLYSYFRRLANKDELVIIELPDCKYEFDIKTTKEKLWKEIISMKSIPYTKSVEYLGSRNSKSDEDIWEAKEASFENNDKTIWKPEHMKIGAIFVENISRYFGSQNYSLVQKVVDMDEGKRLVTKMPKQELFASIFVESSEVINIEEAAESLRVTFIHNSKYYCPANLSWSPKASKRMIAKYYKKYSSNLKKHLS